MKGEKGETKDEAWSLASTFLPWPFIPPLSNFLAACLHRLLMM